MAYNRITEQAKLPKVSQQISFPKSFSRNEKDWTRKLIKQLSESKLISDLDIQLVFKYAKTKFLMDEVEEQLAKVGITDTKQFSELTKTYNSLASTFIRLSKEIGLTPRTVRNKAKLDEREVLNTSNVEYDDSEINMEGWVFEDDED